MYIAHTRNCDGKTQPLLDHLEQTAGLAANFAKAFGGEAYAERAGLLHDIGKYSDAFQKRIRGATNRCDHSTAGAREADKLGLGGRLLAYCIAGHHTGLPNAGSGSDTGIEGTLSARMRAAIPPYAHVFEELPQQALAPLARLPIAPIGKKGFSLSFFVRMLYSCLVDADFLDTERFVKNNAVDRTANYDFPAFTLALQTRLAAFSPNGAVNQKRAQILADCRRAAQLEQGLFTLTVPTGGGKTLSSLAFALEHLQKKRLSRIIYVIPYTAIIEQNAAVFESLLGRENVLQHHSNFDFSDDENRVGNKLKLAAENWDIPLVVTTNVQFFESLYAAKSSRCRKLHNIANSVIILDEAQMLPINYLLPCTRALCELVRNYGCSAVLCSATQPTLDRVLDPTLAPVEICSDAARLHTAFRRTEIVDRGLLETSALARELSGVEQVLCIVNTRKHALAIYDALDRTDSVHLSALMCPAHRLKVITAIRDRLQKKQTCRVVSTRLIEAGVDVDFPLVYRSMCGLDSIIQSAGRCNREGRLTDAFGRPVLGRVHIFEPEEEYSRRQPAAFKRPISVTKELMRRHEDILSPEAVRAYFARLYQLAGDGVDQKSIVSRLEQGFDRKHGELWFNFRDIAEEFKLIENNTRAVIIPYDQNARELIQSLRQSPALDVLRALQRYTVSVYEPEFNGLKSIGAIDEIPEKEVFILREDSNLYDACTGLALVHESGNGIYL